VKIFLCSDATDMRKGFDSLAHLVESSLALDPLSGHLYKRLERGSLRFPTAAAQATGNVEIKAADLMMILDGVDLGSVRRQRRYSRETVEIPVEGPF
jgi:transposase